MAPRILALAYACEPESGSEPGSGWVWAQLLAEIGETWVITRANNRSSIENASPSPHNVRLRFRYVDLPKWLRFWKKGNRGIRLYYLLWQVVAFREARRLQRNLGFDYVWHLTIANAWIGSLVSLLDGLFIYGPVGGGVSTDWRLFKALGVRGTIYELVRECVRTTSRYLNPLARLAWRRAELILVQNQETLLWLPRRHRPKVEIQPNVVLEKTFDRVGGYEGKGETPTALFAGRLLAWKGASLAVQTLAGIPGWRLIIAGAGPDEPRLRRLSRRLRVEDRVHFRGWLPPVELARVMAREADVFLYPSLHDDAGWVIAEALSCGLPVVSLNRGGPPLLAGADGICVPAKTPGRTVQELQLAVIHAYQRGRASGEAAESLMFEQVRENLIAILHRRGLLATKGQEQ